MNNQFHNDIIYWFIHEFTHEHDRATYVEIKIKTNSSIHYFMYIYLAYNLSSLTHSKRNNNREYWKNVILCRVLQTARKKL